MCVRARACVYVSMSVSVCECLNMHLYLCARAAQLGGRAEARACVCVYVCVSVCMYLYLHVLHSWEGDLKHVRVKTREDQEGRTLYTFGNEVWKPTIAELVRYFRNHRLYIANENTHLYLDKPVCKPHEKLDEE